MSSDELDSITYFFFKTICNIKWHNIKSQKHRCPLYRLFVKSEIPKP